MNTWPLVGMIVVCNACADLLNTAGMRRYGEATDFGPKGILRLFNVVGSKQVFVGRVYRFGDFIPGSAIPSLDR